MRTTGAIEEKPFPGDEKQTGLVYGSVRPAAKAPPESDAAPGNTGRQKAGSLSDPGISTPGWVMATMNEDRTGWKHGGTAFFSKFLRGSASSAFHMPWLDR